MSKKTRRTDGHRMTAYTACIASRGKNYHFYVPWPSFFVCPGDAPVAITQNIAWMKRQFSASQTPRSMYLSIFNSFRVIGCLIQCVSPKIAIFTYRSPHFYPLETPLRLSRNMLHGWKEKSVLAEPLAAYTCLSSTVSQLFEPQVQKNRRFHNTLRALIGLNITPWVSQGHCERNHWTDHTRLTISRVIWRWILSWPWNVG